MNLPNYGNKEINSINQPSHLKEYLEKKDRIQKAMDKMKLEAARDLGVSHVRIPSYGGELTSYEIGVHAGPVGGVIVKDLIAQGEKALLEKYGKK